MVWIDIEIQQLNVLPLGLLLKELIEDVPLNVLAGIQDVYSQHISRCQVKRVPEADLVVEVIEGSEAKVRTVLHHRVDVIVGC